ncbi:hypothetical protein DMA11_20460 [Marinilabiliaceae bacterium JC017]|nr:hypothetical protein DMA11_20460 [Marinilabiliaceae bacterium JC017]
MSTIKTPIKASLKGSIACFLFFLFSTVQANDTLKYTSTFQEMLYLKYPALQSGNTSTLLQIPKLNIGMGALRYIHQQGTLKRSMDGTSKQLTGLNIYRYHHFKKATVFGQFNYNNNSEASVNYTSINDPYRGTPYFLCDTLTGGQYKRETFYLKGAIALPLSHFLDLGISSTYHMGLSYQNYDPRAKNVISHFSLSPGITYHTMNWKLGAHIHYAYYNEDIDITIVESNKTATFYSLSGLGYFNEFFNASGAYRLYERHNGAVGLQIQHKQHLLEVTGEQFYEQIKDGRGNQNNKNWHQVKTPFLLTGRTFVAKETYQQKSKRGSHILTGQVTYKKQTGTEIFQRLENTNENTPSANWVTYAKLDKYHQTQIRASLSHTWYKMRSAFIRQMGFSGKIQYICDNEQVMEAEITEKHYQNLHLYTDAEHSFLLKNGLIVVKAQATYITNLQKKISKLPVTFFSKEIALPDFRYVTANHFTSGCTITYERKLPHDKTHCFITGRYLLHLNNKWLSGQKRHETGISVGISW